MLALLTNFEINVVVAVVVGGVCLSPLGTKIKDWFKGIPSDLRAGLNGVEATVLSNAKAAQAHVIASLPIAAAKTPAPPAA